MPLTTLGKRKHKILRDNGVGGEWIDGEWVVSEKFPVIIYANVQPSFGSPLLKLLPESQREKESVLIFSDHWVYTSRTGDDPQDADILLYRGAEWLVQISRPFQNFGTHCEAIAVKIKDEVIPRKIGIVGVADSEV